ncbi:class I SAM-dependent methyltransferase [Catenuloplanes atrovinosus]|uniref:Cyclopropane-fatty-acyl-phospholipid synthase n=1 Tax=Catenuloplanes atrovinosus TaxID=137266 RepID=A0AAE3YIF4_9ACTN|nr:class I SAM-dependent methyltransferase [Catenuloplanes atrovinosus]MDR7274294.1 cyclopropane-fatty-acyl-phospholipid synthase [Catenuloplanes atrovinosus]
MSTTPSTADRLRTLFQPVLRGGTPIRLRAWDGSETGPADAPALVIHDRRALRRLLWKPNQLGLARAWVAGEIDVDGDLYELLLRLATVVWNEDGGGDRPGALRLLREAASLGVLGPQPPPPPEEVRMPGRAHTRSRDRRAISHHYDVSNDFYRLILGPSMVYSCAYWRDDESTLDVAQRDKLDLICRKLGLRKGQRLLDVGCGWGSLAIHAAREYGVEVVGVTISREQADLARKRAAEAGLADRVEIRLQDYREVTDGPYDAIASVGMAEHVGPAVYAAYAAILFRLLRPGGRLLNHQIAARTDTTAVDADDPSFINRYVFPDGQLVPLGTTATLIEDAGFEIRDVEALRPHYALTLREWSRNLEAHWDEAVELAGLGRARVWRLYMAACALAFETDRIGVNQILAVRPHEDGRDPLPMTRAWMMP